MKLLKALKWIALNAGLAFLAYKAVIENSDGCARVYQFWMWISSVCVFTTAFNDELRTKLKREPSVPVKLNSIADIAFCLFFIYHGWWMTGIASFISMLGSEKMYEKENE